MFLKLIRKSGDPDTTYIIDQEYNHAVGEIWINSRIPGDAETIISILSNALEEFNVKSE